MVQISNPLRVRQCAISFSTLRMVNTMTDPTNRPPLYAWKDWPEDCPECGGPLQVFTDDSREGWATHGDTVRCVDPECGARGHINADAEDNCYAMLPDLDP
jgi:N6-adenosine-specific RNA methylase IME4